MRKQAEASAAAAGARRATGAGASRRGAVFGQAQARDGAPPAARGGSALGPHVGGRTEDQYATDGACDARRMTPPVAIVACRRAVVPRLDAPPYRPPQPKLRRV